MANPHEGRPPHPRYGAPLGGRPITVLGVTFRPYRTGIGDTARCSDDFRITIAANKYGTGRHWTYTALVDGVSIRSDADERHAKRFRSDRTAAEAAVRALQQRTKENP
jgi:hypothetical protein